MGWPFLCVYGTASDAILYREIGWKIYTISTCYIDNIAV